MQGGGGGGSRRGPCIAMLAAPPASTAPPAPLHTSPRAPWVLPQFCLFFAQSGLVLWRKRHKRSYDLVTLLGLWLIPPIICLHVGYWRFITVSAGTLEFSVASAVQYGPCPARSAGSALQARHPACLAAYSALPCPRCPCTQVWTLYSAVTLYYLWACSFKKLDKTLPKQVRQRQGGVRCGQCYGGGVLVCACSI